MAVWIGREYSDEKLILLLMIASDRWFAGAYKKVVK